MKLLKRILFFATLPKKYVAMCVRTVPNPHGDMLLTGSIYRTGEVLTEKELRKVYNSHKENGTEVFSGTSIEGLVALTNILHRDLVLVDNVDGCGYSFMPTGKEIPYRENGHTRKEAEDLMNICL